MSMNRAELRKKLYNDWVKRLDKHNVLTSYACPGCSTEIKTLIPSDTEEIYDIMTMCPHCDQLFYKIVHHNGVVETR